MYVAAAGCWLVPLQYNLNCRWFCSHIHLSKLHELRSQGACVGYTCLLGGLLLLGSPPGAPRARLRLRVLIYIRWLIIVHPPLGAGLLVAHHAGALGITSAPWTACCTIGEAMIS
jgi:hypothetical protein